MFPGESPNDVADLQALSVIDQLLRALLEDSPLIREAIIEAYKSEGALPSYDAIAARVGLSREAVLQRLRSEPPIESMQGLSPAQALLILKHFGEVRFFSDSIEKALETFATTREKIREIENRGRK